MFVVFWTARFGRGTSFPTSLAAARWLRDHLTEMTGVTYVAIIYIAS